MTIPSRGGGGGRAGGGGGWWAGRRAASGAAHRDHDDGHALDGVSDGVRDRVDGGERDESTLVVHIVRDARRQQHAHEGPLASELSDGGGGAGGELRALDQQGERQQQRQRLECEQSVPGEGWG